MCNLLLDQAYFAGLGNYIKNDALYLSKIHPDKKSNNMTQNQIKNLYENILIISFSNVASHLKNANLKIPAKIEKLCHINYMYHINFLFMNKNMIKRK